jgi:signal-transduction protein with cAMP-binding, CBS, and nucleotidyltransferase domain
MESRDPVSAVLHRKSPEIWSVASTTSVYDALRLMSDKEIGAVLVTSSGKTAGIFSERDYARKVILMGRASKETSVSEIMTTPAISVSPEQTVSECMRIMTHERVRHLIVVKGGETIGVISIGDLVNWIITSQDDTIAQLHGYISGTYPA